MDNRHFGNEITGRCLLYKGGAFIERHFDREISRACLNWRFYAGGAFIKVADSAILTVRCNDVCT